mmetsp:Transcript_5078/g.5204  ORF Transcript_5078/g.5204 Transcript_5078/m.5204 type:complete len:540 (-) Transcript_5078:70-1689(-)
MTSFLHLFLSILLLIAKPTLNCAFHQAQRFHTPINNRLSDRGVKKLQANLNGLQLRGGFVTPLVTQVKSSLLQSPSSLFNGLFLSLAALALFGKVVTRSKSSGSSEESAKPEGVKLLQAKFLVVFWLMRMADWLQGPYFYEVYSSKIINGLPVSLDLVSKIFLVGFATTGIFGPFIGRFVDTVGRKAGTLAYAALYAIGALSTRSAVLPLLILGRIAGGLGTSLLFSAPEAWLVGEHQKGGYDGKWLGQTFGWAYAGDSLVAITAGQLASLSAAKSGPSGPFSLSLLFLALGSLITTLKWTENVAPQAVTESSDGKDNNDSQSKPTIGDAWKVMKGDKRILLLGAVQSLFEGSMYIFVLQWPPAIKAAIQASKFGAAASIPFGTVFSCLMASCLLGSTAFGALQSKNVKVESSTSVMTAVAAVSMAAAALAGSTNLAALIASFVAFEACVGMYFPSIGTLRSKIIPDSHRSVIMNIFGIPLNLLVVSVFLSIKSLGTQGALGCATAALTVSSICMNLLNAGVGEKKVVEKVIDKEVVVA